MTQMMKVDWDYTPPYAPEPSVYCKRCGDLMALASQLENGECKSCCMEQGKTHHGTLSRLTEEGLTEQVWPLPYVYVDDFDYSKLAKYRLGV